MAKLKTLSAFIVLLMTSCYVAPQSVYYLKPTEDSGAWLMGKQYFHCQTDDFLIALAFDKMQYDSYEFEVEITNLSDSVFFVSPQNFYMVSNLYSQDKIVFSDTFDVIDPEEQILATQMNQSRADAAYQSSQNTQSLFFFLDLVGDIASIGDPKTEQQIIEEENEDLQREIDALETELAFENDSKVLNDHLSKWQSVALRNTTLPADYLIRGQIYFPKIRGKRGIEIHLELLDEHIVFNYNQFEEKVK